MPGSSAFRRSLPVTTTSFINKAGTIGLSIIPILLVERQIPAGEAASIMGLIKGAGFVGIMMGGWFCDTLGLRATLLLSFLVSGLGMLPLPFVESAALLALFGGLAQLGTSFYHASARLLVAQLVPFGERSEAIAWQRTANNLAQILAFSLGAVLGKLGTGVLLLFDAATSFLAAGVGAVLLPKGGRAETKKQAESGIGATHREFFHGALIIALFSLLYEVYEVSAAAKCKLLFGTQGLQIFSQMMVLNTLICAAFSVFAARYLRKAAWVLPIGQALLAGGLLVAFCLGNHKLYFFAGAFLVTVGEIFFNALSAMVLIEFTPAGKNQATRYSSGVLLQFTGRIVGAVIAFPLVVTSAQPAPLLIFLSVLSMAVCLAFRKQLARI